MNALFGRRLACLVGAFALAVGLQVYVPEFPGLLVAGAMFPSAVILMVLRKTGALSRNYGFIVMALAAGFLWSGAYNFFMVVPAGKLHGQETETVCEVMEFPSFTDRYTNVLVRLECDGLQNPVKARISLPANIALEPGDRFKTVLLLSVPEKTEAFDFYIYYAAKGVFLQGVYRPDGTVEHLESAGGIKYAPVKIQRAVGEQLKKIFGEGSFASALMTALLLGDKGGLDDTYTTALSISGLSHMVAVSGMHIGFLVQFVMMTVRHKRRAAIITMPVVVLFVLVIGSPASAVRGGLMQIGYLTGFLTRRENDGITSMSAALLILLLANPMSVADVGLQLSFCGTLGILIFASRIRDGLVKRLSDRIKKRGFIRGGAALLASSLSAIFLTTPLSAYYFGSVSLVAPLSNLLALPVVTFLFSAGVCLLLLGAVLLPIAQGAAFLLSPVFAYLHQMPAVLSKIPYAAIDVRNTYMVLWLFSAYVLLIYWLFIKKTWRRTALTWGSMAGTLALALIFTSFPAQHGELNITVLNVGQGQAIVALSGGKTAVIDCGGNRYPGAGEITAQYLRGLGRTKIDYLVLTHYHSDHANGVETLAEWFDIDTALLPAIASEERNAMAIALRAKGVRIQVTRETRTYPFGGGEMTVYAPVARDGENEQGACILLKLNDFEAMVTGDLGMASERVLVSREAIPDIEVLLVGHHGSKYSTAQEFLEAVLPDVAVISSGRNNYGHPSQAAIDRLVEAGADIYRTDLSGNVYIAAAS
ncbi:DNA internalization-related competence protein ComEC/Rec2 [Oscillospiraceae bacterium OttesenSCG-928-F05]|nr:DNA internalization-related competence protein ComEC/Rec2 [Oscillospiraceae bacterium OttesenSCG-928-F05]